jgi:hypothetical protein
VLDFQSEQGHHPAMKKVFIMIMVLAAAVQLLACAVQPAAPSQTTPGTVQPDASGPVAETVEPSAPVSETVKITPSASETARPPVSTAAVPKITVEEVKRKIDSAAVFVLVDVRSKADYNRSHIVGAISVPVKDISARSAEFSPESEIIVYSACT